MRGTNGPDLLHGTPKPDLILGLGGNDRIVAQLGGRDTISCGPGFDVVSADLYDRVARDCEVVSREISRDPIRGGAGQHETEVEPDSFAFGSTVVATFQVGRIADGGADAIGFAASRDGGRSWTSGILPSVTTSSVPAGPFERASDPSVAYDAEHGVWLIVSLVLSPGRTSALLVSRSADGTRWSAPVPVALGPAGDLAYDKEWIVCDNGSQSPFRGHCYVSYSDLASVQLATQTSTDGGLTWSNPIGSADGTGRAGIVSPLAPAPQPVVQPNGNVVIPLLDGFDVVAVRSTDGGATFSNSIPISRISVPGPPAFRAPELPSAEVDAAGTIYLAWPDCRFRSGCAVNDIVLTHSTDGLSWTAPERVPLDGVGSGIDHYLPGLGVDPTSAGSSARLALSYYTLRNGRLDVGFVSSHDGGATWSRPLRLSPESMPLDWLAEAQGRFVGDYMSTSFVGGLAVPVFVLASQPTGVLHEAVFASRLGVR